MKIPCSLTLLAAACCAACSAPPEGGAAATARAVDQDRSRTAPASTHADAGETMSHTTIASLQDFQTDAARNRVVLDLPVWEKTPTQVETAVRSALERADARIDALAVQDANRVTFESVFVALDDIAWDVGNVARRMWVIRSTGTDPNLREAATEQINVINDWSVGLQYREDVYETCRAFAQRYEAGRRPRLRGEDLRLFEETMRDYRRAGLDLSREKRAEVESLQKRLARVETEFSSNITRASEPITFTRAEIEGVPQPFIDAARTGDDEYTFMATVTPQFLAIMENAEREQTRKIMKTARYSLLQQTNGPILDEMVRLRDRIATLLGYDSWADYQTEIRMARSGGAAMDFVKEMSAGLEPKFRQELTRMQAMKAEDAGDPETKVRHWDWRYYSNQIKKQGYAVDTEALREYFPYRPVLRGMFDVYGEIFGLRFQRVRAPWVWHEDVELYATIDSRTDEPLGLFYLDMFPREGKYNHFAQFGITAGKRLESGRHHRPVVALVCNFTPPREGRPSLLTHSEVETLFHEFGHCVHSILTRAEHGRFAGTSVPRDFVEAPSQMLENWVWDTAILNRFAGHYEDRSKKIEPDVLARMEDAKLATIGAFYRRQLAFALSDLRLHDAGAYKDAREICNDTMAEIFLAPPQDTHFAAYWGHLAGYDAGYYGYAWADAIAADMATAFEKAPGGFLDREVGMRLRNEIYAVGGARDVEASIEAFLGRDRSIEPFLKSLGIDQPGGH